MQVRTGILLLKTAGARGSGAHVVRGSQLGDAETIQVDQLN